MKTFEIKTPDGRTLRQQHASLEVAKAALQPGYEVTGEVIGAQDGKGGWALPVGDVAQEFAAWIEGLGFRRVKDVTPKG